MEGQGVQISRPKVYEGPVEQAFKQATAQSEPMLVPVRVFADDRGWSLMNQFQEVLKPSGQINYSVMYPGVVKAWHRHQQQTDFWLPLHGMLKVGIYREADQHAWQAVIGEMQPAVMIIPPPLWHGAATVGPSSAGLLYYVTHQYNHDAPDEERLAHDAIEDFPWHVQHR